MSTIGTLVNWLPQVFVDEAGVPLAGGFVTFKDAGLNTLKDTFSTSDLDPVGVNANPLELDSGGRPPTACFLEAGLYDAFIADANSVLVRTVLGFGVPAAETPTGLGKSFSVGARNVVTGYTVLDADLLITVNEPTTNPAIINLPAVSTRTQQLVVKNLSTATGVQLVPNGSDKIDVSLSTYTLNAASSPPPIFPTVLLYPDGENNANWMIAAGHG